MSHVPYSSAIGSIMYVLVCIHLDISQAINIGSIYIVNPSKVNLQAMKLIFRYLQGTTDVSLVYNRCSGIGSNVISYVDSNYAGNLNKRISLTSYVFTLSKCAISWKMTLQSTVSFSTTKAKYMAIVEAVK